MESMLLVSENYGQCLREEWPTLDPLNTQM